MPAKAKRPSPSKSGRAPVGFCRICGCDDSHACPGGCYWVQTDLCSACVQEGLLLMLLHWLEDVVNEKRLRDRVRATQGRQARPYGRKRSR